MRELYGKATQFDDKEADDLIRRTYAAPGPLVRWNMISTLDGSGTGPDGVTGSINNEVDFRAFGFLRAWADAVVVGAGTAREEGYTPLRGNRWRDLRANRSPAPLLTIVSRSGALPPSLAAASADQVLLVRGDDVKPAEVLQRLNALGHDRILLEGGPALASQFVEAGLIDELCLTIVPSLVGGDGPRITAGIGLTSSARLLSVLEQDGTLLTRWALRAGQGGA